MNEFEQEVLSAIEDRWIATAPGVFPADDAVQRACQQIREALASDVAAAIEAVVHEHRGNISAAEWPGMQASAYQAALAALRGKKP